MTNGKLKLVVSSKKVLARVEEFQTGGVSTSSLMAWNGQLLSSRRRIAIYDYVLDEEQMKALTTAKEIAGKSGLVLEVIDLSRQNPLKRMLRLGMTKVSGEGLARYKTALKGHQDEPVSTRSRAFRP